jgi:hypothetical protein
MMGLHSPIVCGLNRGEKGMELEAWRSACIHPTGLWKIGLEVGVEAMRKSVVNFFCMFFLALLSQLLYPNAQLPI